MGRVLDYVVTSRRGRALDYKGKSGGEFGLGYKGVAKTARLMGTQARTGSLGDISVAAAGEGEEGLGVFAHPGLDVVAGNVVPYNTVVVEVVEDGHAGLVVTVLGELAVIGLTLPRTTGGGPVTSPSLGGVGGGDTGLAAGPEPSVHHHGLEVGPFAAIEVALAAGSPDVLNVALLHCLVHKAGLIGGLQTHQVLAMLPADVPGIEPIPLVLAGGAVRP